MVASGAARAVGHGSDPDRIVKLEPASTVRRLLAMSFGALGRLT